jgi:hypothetical protein
MFAPSLDAGEIAELKRLLSGEDISLVNVVPTLQAAVGSSSEVLVLFMDKEAFFEHYEKQLLPGLLKRKVVGIGDGAAQIFGSLGLDICALHCGRDLSPRPEVQTRPATLFPDLKPQRLTAFDMADSRSDSQSLFDWNFAVSLIDPTIRRSVQPLAVLSAAPDFAAVTLQGNFILSGVAAPPRLWTPPYKTFFATAVRGLLAAPLKPFVSNVKEVALPGEFAFDLLPYSRGTDGWLRTLRFQFDKPCLLSVTLGQSGSDNGCLTLGSTFRFSGRRDCKPGEQVEITELIRLDDLGPAGPTGPRYDWRVNVANHDTKASAKCRLKIQCAYDGLEAFARANGRVLQEVRTKKGDWLAVSEITPRPGTLLKEGEEVSVTVLYQKRSPQPVRIWVDGDHPEGFYCPSLELTEEEGIVCRSFGSYIPARSSKIIVTMMDSGGKALACLKMDAVYTWEVEKSVAKPPVNALKGLEAREGRFYKDGKPYRGVGANYFDLLLRVLHNPADRSSLEGLERLARAGIPFVRFGGPFSAQEWRLYLDDREEYFRRFDLVVRAAEKSGIGLIPSLFWTLTLCETVGEPRDQWGNPESKTMALMRRYTADVVERYKGSPALWAWEFGNETNLKADLPNAAQYRPKGGNERDDVTSAHLVTMIAEFAKEVRKHDPSRAILSGNSHARPTAWNNTANKNWTADTQAQAKEIILRDNPAPLDTIGVHVYGDSDNPHKELGDWVAGRLHYFRWLKGVAREAGRPVFVGEFGLARPKDGRNERQVYEALLAEMEQTNIDLAAFWVYDLSGQEKTWNVTFGNERAYMISLTVEANRRWGQNNHSGH